MSLIENTRPRYSSSICCCRIVAVQIATPCAASPSANPMTRNGTCRKLAPSRPVRMPPAASSTVIQADLASRLVAYGVTSAAVP